MDTSIHVNTFKLSTPPKDPTPDSEYHESQRLGCICRASQRAERKTQYGHSCSSKAQGSFPKWKSKCRALFYFPAPFHCLQDEPETPVYDDTTEEVPKIYRQVEIEYSKFGVEDFDFGRVLRLFPSNQH